MNEFGLLLLGFGIGMITAVIAFKKSLGKESCENCWHYIDGICLNKDITVFDQGDDFYCNKYKQGE